jgi:putative endonuclease
MPPHPFALSVARALAGEVEGLSEPPRTQAHDPDPHLPVSAGDSTKTAPWAVYLLECADGRVYTGIARDPQQRYATHLAGKGARFTRSNPPKQLLGWVWIAEKGDALRLEMAWKRLPRAARVAALQAAMQAAERP